MAMDMQCVLCERKVGGVEGVVAHMQEEHISRFKTTFYKCRHCSFHVQENDISWLMEHHCSTFDHFGPVSVVKYVDFDTIESVFAAFDQMLTSSGLNSPRGPIVVEEKAEGDSDVSSISDDDNLISLDHSKSKSVRKKAQPKPSYPTKSSSPTDGMLNESIKVEPIETENVFGVEEALPAIEVAEETPVKTPILTIRLDGSPSSPATPHLFPTNTSHGTPEPKLLQVQNNPRAQYECVLCKVKIVNPSQHVIYHHLKKPMIACPLCSYTEKYQLYNMTAHIANKHPGQNVEPLDYRRDPELLRERRALVNLCFGESETTAANYMQRLQNVSGLYTTKQSDQIAEIVERIAEGSEQAPDVFPSISNEEDNPFSAFDQIAAQLEEQLAQLCTSTITDEVRLIPGATPTYLLTPKGNRTKYKTPANSNAKSNRTPGTHQATARKRSSAGCQNRSPPKPDVSLLDLIQGMFDEGNAQAPKKHNRLEPVSKSIPECPDVSVDTDVSVVMDFLRRSCYEYNE